jgi:hypothetical protein
MGCARGGDDMPPVGTDAGPARRDAGPRDAGRDSGGNMGCEEIGYAATCQDATELEPILAGGRVESGDHLVPRASAQWVRLSFPSMPPAPIDGGVMSMAGSGQPRIRFLRNDGDVYRIEIRNACVGVASCGSGGNDTGMATNLTEWSFGDDPLMSAEGDGQFSTRNTPWPETVYVRIYPRADPACGRYRIEITR